jgi:hypothetical protein
MRKDDLPKRRTTFKFETPGDRLAGEITSHKFIDSKYEDDDGEKVRTLLLDLDSVDGPVRYYAGRKQQEAIREALDLAEVDELLIGGWLELLYVANIDTPGATNPARRWESVYEPPAQSAPSWAEKPPDLFASDKPIGVGTLEDADEDADVS